MSNNVLYLVIVLVCGLTLGSFVNAYVWRVHKQSQIRSKDSKIRELNKRKYSILTGRSICPDCEHVLAAKDLVPLFSWIILDGKCRYCRKKISLTYPLVEASTLILFGVSYIFWPVDIRGVGLLEFVFWLIFLVNLIALGLYDIKWLTLPNRMVYPLFGLMTVQILSTVIFFDGSYGYLLGCLYGFLIGGGIFYLLFQVSSGRWIGGGDVRLGALLGLILGSGVYAGMMIFLSSLIGTALAVPLLASGRLDRKTLIPYGPYLITAAIIIRLFGSSLTSWLKVKGIYI